MLECELESTVPGELEKKLKRSISITTILAIKYRDSIIALLSRFAITSYILNLSAVIFGS